MLHPKYKRHFRQIIGFAFIWLIFGLLYTIVEVGLLGESNVYPATGNPYSFKANIVYTSLGCFAMGLFQGWIEVIWLRKRFEEKPLWVKIVNKSLIYLILIIVFLLALTTINIAINFNNGVFNAQVFEGTRKFVSGFSFWSIVIFISFTINLALLFSELEDYMGTTIFYNFLLGKYHNPNQETRIFMFLDMKSSTTIAESIGHARYFDLIKMYYSDMTGAILETSGEIYQYVGDEIVVSWNKKKGIANNNCIECYKKLVAEFEKESATYIKKFGLVPSFKAAYHIGEVTSGEIGIIKKDIIYTGDVLNTTARIQAKCNEYNAQILVSNELKNLLPETNNFIQIGTLILRGKKDPIQLHRINL